jgi:signal transduction histidine kinase
VELDVRHGDQIPDGVALSAFRIVQEALTNVVKHAAPTSCRVRLTAENGTVTIEVTDDGPRSTHRRCPGGGGLGLIGMRERAAAHGGTVTAGPRADGGFTVNATLRY